MLNSDFSVRRFSDPGEGPVQDRIPARQQFSLGGLDLLVRNDAPALQGLAAFERRKTFQHPPQADVLGEYWVNAPEGDPQVVVIWEAEDEGPADYYDAAWGDIFDITTSLATKPVSELPEELPESLRERM